MKYHFRNVFLIFGILIPSFLLSACSDKKEIIHISTKSKVWLGVNVKNVSERRLNNLKLDYGLEVIKVYKESPAEKAGLQIEDILLEINGSPLKNASKLSNIIKDKKVDEKIKIKYLRNGKELETEATMSKRDRKIIVLDEKYRNLDHFVLNEKQAWLGVLTSNLTDQLRQFFKVPEDLGVLVKEVVEDSPAEKYGLKAGDVILQIDNKEVEDTYDLMRAINRSEVGDEVEVKLIRNKEEKTLKVILGEGKRRFRPHFKYRPDKFEFYAPEIEIEIPQIDIDIPEIDMKELRELHEKMREKFDLDMDELNEELEDINEELKEIKIRTRDRKSIVI